MKLLRKLKLEKEFIFIERVLYTEALFCCSAINKEGVVFHDGGGYKKYILKLS